MVICIDHKEMKEVKEEANEIIQEIANEINSRNLSIEFENELFEDHDSLS
jgi:hypothetical protein